ncbi:MAG TPA: helix-hairpin-helix domain-containing protein [Gemmataceae bacterium]|jgi:competence protein ComEA
MDAAPSPVGVAAASPTPPPEWPEAKRWLAPTGDLSVRLPDAPASAWSRPAQGTAALLLLLSLVLLAWHTYAAQRWSCRPATLEPAADDPPFVELNQADHAQLLQLPGVGENLARRIEAYRVEHHGFRNVEELRQVGGIGPKLLEKLRPFVHVEPAVGDEEGEPSREPLRRVVPERQREKQPVAVKGKKVLPAQPLDVNRATQEDLQRLPGIGPKLSQRLVEARAKKAFQSVDDLRRVPGIGPKILERLRPHVVVLPEREALAP